MNVIKTVPGFACSILILLLTLIGFIENPEKERYEKTVESLMIQEGFSSFQEVLDSVPELADIQSKMERIAYLSKSIHSITGGPAPNVSKEKSQQIQGYNLEIRQLRINIQEELSQLIVTYAEGQSSLNTLEKN